jgi:hypothetical protein
LFENRVGAEEDIWASVKGEWRRQYDRQLYELNCPPFIIRGNNSSRKRWVGHVARMADRGGEMYRVVVERTEERRSLGRPKCKWYDNIKIDLQEMGCGVMNWIVVVQDSDRRRAFVNAVMNFKFYYLNN